MGKRVKRDQVTPIKMADTVILKGMVDKYFQNIQKYCCRW